MNLANLINDIERLAMDGSLPIWLVTRTVEGQRIEEIELVATVGGISVDEETPELILLSADWVQEDEIGGITTINEFCNWAAESQGQFANFLLYGAQKQIDLPDGRSTVRTCSALDAWLLPNSPEALWLLFAPLDQCPSQWFAT